MKKQLWFLAVCAVVVVTLMGFGSMMDPLHGRVITVAPIPAPVTLKHPIRAAELLAHRPVLFEANYGQFDASVRFVSRGNGYKLFLTADEAIMRLASSSSVGAGRRDNSGAVFRLRLLGGSQPRRIEGLDEQSIRSHYFTGGDPAAWHSGVPSYAKVRYEAVYPGVDLVYYGQDGLLEYDFIVAPGADPSRIGLSYAGVERLSVDARGDLMIETAAGIVKQHAPVVYQEHDGVRQSVASRYRVQDERVSFQLAAYDSSQPLIIDPTLSYVSYLGGSGDDVINDIAVDAQGAIYVTGQASSDNLPGVSASVYSGGADAFVSKFSAAGELLFTTYLGGGEGGYFGDMESGNALAVDGAGHIYVTGEAVSGFPRVLDSISNGYCFTTSTEAFVVRLDDNGVLLYSDCFGGGLQDSGQGLALDAAGDVYVTGWTGSGDFVDAGTGYGGRDAFAFKLGLGGSGGVIWSRYIGGTGGDMGRDITLTADAVTIVGATNSTNLVPSAVAYGVGGDIDVFVTRLSQFDGEVLWSRVIGGSGADSEVAGADDGHLAIASDFAGAVYITGQTRSADFPLSNAYQATLHGGADVFVTKLSAMGDIQISTYLGGSDDDAGHDLAVTASAGTIVLTGRTLSTDFPAADTNEAGFPYKGFGDAFVARLGATLRPQYALYYGGSGDDAGHAIALQDDGSVYIGGMTDSVDLAYVDQYPLAQQAATGFLDGFVARIGADADLVLDVTESTGSGSLVYTIVVTNNGPGIATHVVATVQLSGVFSYLSSDAQCVDSAPQGIAVCDFDQMAAGAVRQASVTMMVDQAVQTPGVTVSANEYDTNLDNNVFGGGVLPSTVSPPLLVVTDSGAGMPSSGGGGSGFGVLLVILAGCACRCVSGWRLFQRRFDGVLRC